MSHAVSQAKGAILSGIGAQQSLPTSLNHAREADIQALSNLTRALDKQVRTFLSVLFGTDIRFNLYKVR